MNSFNNLDAIFFLTTLAIVAVACYRGAVKEVFSLLNWIVGFALSYLISPFLSQQLSPFFDSKLILDVSTRIAIFMISFITFLLLTSSFTSDLTESMNTYLNRFLGLCFGLLKSLLIFGLFFSLYNCFFDYALGRRLVKSESSRMPKWFTESYSAPIITFSGELIDPIVRGFIGILKINFSDALKIQDSIKYKAEEGVEKDNLLDNNQQNFKNYQNENPTPEKSEIKKNSFTQQKNDLGYDKKDIQKMQKLIEIINQ